LIEEGQMRNPKDFWTGVVFTGLGVATVVIARDYPFGTATKMGPGYFPSVLGGLLALIGLIAIVRSFLQSGERIKGLAWKPIVLVLGASVLFGFLVREAGLAVAIAVMVMVSAYASVMFRWIPSVALALGLAVFSVVVFVKALGLPMPALGSWFGG
jgi:Tripartite tricarboxylate transporter TctB family